MIRDASWSSGLIDPMGQVSVPGAEVFRAAIDSDPALLDAGSRLIFLLLLLFSVADSGLIADYRVLLCVGYVWKMSEGRLRRRTLTSFKRSSLVRQNLSLNLPVLHEMCF